MSDFVTSNSAGWRDMAQPLASSLGDTKKWSMFGCICNICIYIWVWINTYENTIFRGMNIHESQLFWCELQGYKVLTHCHIYICIYICVFGINFNRQSVDAFGVGHCLTPNWWAQASPVIRRCDGCNVLRPNWRKKKTRGKSLPQKCHVGPRKRNR